MTLPTGLYTICSPQGREGSLSWPLRNQTIMLMDPWETCTLALMPCGTLGWPLSLRASVSPVSGGISTPCTWLQGQLCGVAWKPNLTKDRGWVVPTLLGDAPPHTSVWCVHAEVRE